MSKEIVIKVVLAKESTTCKSCGGTGCTWDGTYKCEHCGGSGKCNCKACKSYS